MMYPRAPMISQDVGGGVHGYADTELLLIYNTN